MSKVVGVVLTIIFLSSSVFTSYLLWLLFGWRVIAQIVVILSIGSFGEHHISGQGYYSYTSYNGIFMGRVPLWVPFMWLCTIQCIGLFMYLIGITGFFAVLGSGVFGALLDFLVVEPIFCKFFGLWEWTQVNDGYFSFFPTELNRFTAPIGNYIVWLGFCALGNWILGSLVMMLP